MARDYNNSIIIYRNPDKDFNSTDPQEKKKPDCKGFGKVDGVPYWISGWTNVPEEGRFAGQRVTNLTFRPQQQRGGGGGGSGSGRGGNGNGNRGGGGGMRTDDDGEVVF